MGAAGVREILSDFVGRSEAEFASASYGFALNDAERRRRYFLQSLLHVKGLSAKAYTAEFGQVRDDFPQLADLTEAGLATWQGDTLRLAPAGLEQSDAIGPWFYSADAQRLSAEYELR